MNETIKRLEKIANSWGGSFEEVKSLKDAFHIEDYGVSFVECDSFIGFCHYDKTLYFETKSHWVDIIHGMGHIFCIEKPESCVPCPGEECAIFHSWEYAMVKYLEFSTQVWSRKNKDYTVCIDESSNSYPSFGSLTKDERKRYLNQVTDEAKKLKIIDNAGKPLSIRG